MKWKYEVIIVRFATKWISLDYWTRRIEWIKIATSKKLMEEIMSQCLIKSRSGKKNILEKALKSMGDE